MFRVALIGVIGLIGLTGWIGLVGLIGLRGFIGVIGSMCLIGLSTVLGLMGLLGPMYAQLVNRFASCAKFAWRARFDRFLLVVRVVIGLAGFDRCDRF